jgi:PleD family two-component response regulator
MEHPKSSPDNSSNRVASPVWGTTNSPGRVSASAPTQRSILLVEDQEDDIILMKLAFGRAGLSYPVQSVLGGLEAIAYLSGAPPYQDRTRYPLPVLVFLDVRMPSMDGFECCDRFGGARHSTSGSTRGWRG